MGAAHGVERGAVEREHGSDIEAGALGSAGNVRGDGGGTGGPGQLAIGERTEAGSGSAGQERRISRRGDCAVGYFYDPGIDDVAIPRPGEYDLDDVVINVALSVGGDARGDELGGVCG